MKRERFVAPITYTLLVILAIFTLFPLIWMVFYAIRPRHEMFKFTIPSTISFENFQLAIDALGNPFINSLILSLSTSIINVAICFLAAYAFSRMQFRGKDIINDSLSVIYSIPGIFSVIPIFILFKSIGLLQLHPYISLIFLYHSAQGSLSPVC